MVNPLLLHLAKKGALYRQVELSTTRIANSLGISQQSASRNLILLEKLGEIERAPSPQGVKVRVLAKGAEVLRTEYHALREVFSGTPKSLKGSLMHGLGEGAYYMGMSGYVEQFRRHLGFKPFPGTLNLKVDSAEFAHFVVGKEKIIIQGFKAGERTFGGLDAYLVTIKNISCALIIPHRTSHNREVAEIISREFLRGKLKLKDHDKVEVEP